MAPKKRKIKEPKLPRVGTYRAPRQAVPVFLKVLDGWHTVMVHLDVASVPHAFTYVVSPLKKVFRYAESWENPSLVIDSDILPAAYHIRLVRVTDKRTRIAVKKQLRKKLKLMHRRV